MDLWDLCPECSVTHHDRVTTIDTADLWFVTPTNPAVPSGDTITTKEHTMIGDFDFEEQALAHAYAEALQIVLDRCETVDFA